MVKVSSKYSKIKVQEHDTVSEIIVTNYLPKEKLSDKNVLGLIVTRKYVPLLSSFFLTSYATLSAYISIYGFKDHISCAYLTQGYYYSNSAREFGFKLLQEEKTNPGYISKTFEGIYVRGESLMSFSKKLAKHPVDKLTSKKLQSMWKQFADKYIEFSLSLLAFNLQYPVEQSIRSWLKQDEHLDHNTSILTFPVKENIVAIEQKNVLRIGALLQNKKIQCVDFESLPAAIKTEITKHIGEFGWINTRGGISPVWSGQEILNRINEIKYDCKSKLGELETQRELHLKESNQLLKKLNLDAWQTRVVHIARELVYFRTYRTDYLARIFATARPFFEKLAKHKGISYDDLLNYTVQEITGGIRVSKKELDARRVDYLCATLEQNKIIFSSDEQVIRGFADKYLEKTSQVQSSFKGSIAFKGIVRGPARIVITRGDMAKVKVGDIIIAPMTTPDMVPILEKAIAFVTDEGGITCHAAIVSREMKKPCLIGTKIATRSLKDGDMIEVDAINGVVRKL